MRIASATDLHRIIENKIPEAASLEYKRQLDLETKPHRREVLKDLTGRGMT